MARLSKRTWTGIGAGLAALVLAAGVVGAVSALSDDGDSGDDTVVVAGTREGDGEIETTTSAEHDMDHAGHDDGAGHDDHGNGNGSGSGGTKPKPCDGSGGHDHALARAKCPKPPDPCKDTTQQHRVSRAKCPQPPDPCDDGPHDHSSRVADDDCDPDPCDGHVHNTNPDDPCNPDPCDDTHQHGATTAAEVGCPDDVVQYEDLSPEVQALVDQGTALALQYPTAALAQAAGWRKSTVYFPGIAQHNLKSSLLDSTFDPANPEVLLYGKDGQLVGVNYIVHNVGGPPEGLPGDADHWHEHPSLCLSVTTGLVIGGENLSQAQCAAIGGFVINFQNFWLLHVWTIPGYESPEGVFSHENSKV